MPSRFLSVKKFRSALRVVFINIITLLALLFLTNWLVGFYLRSTDSTSRASLPNYSNVDNAEQIFSEYNSLSFDYEAFVGWKTKPYKGDVTTVNDEGLRVHDQPSDRPGQVVHFFGGSTTWGEGSADNQTIPAFFQAQNLKTTAINHGQLGYNSRQNLNALIAMYDKNVEPEVVVFYDGVNDAAFLCPSDISMPAHRLVPMFRDRIYISKGRMLKKFLSKVFIENILKLVQRNSDSEGNRYNCLDDQKADEIAQFLLNNWKIAHDIVQERGGKFIAILQPSVFTGNPRRDHLTMLDSELEENFRRVYVRVKDKLEEADYPWIYDLTTAFDSKDHIYIDFCHVSPNGNEIMAREISKIYSSVVSDTVQIN